MPISPDLLEILVCPETRQPVALASEAILTKLNSEIAKERLRIATGALVEPRIDLAAGSRHLRSVELRDHRRKR